MHYISRINKSSVLLGELFNPSSVRLMWKDSIQQAWWGPHSIHPPALNSSCRRLWLWTSPLLFSHVFSLLPPLHMHSEPRKKKREPLPCVSLGASIHPHSYSKSVCPSTLFHSNASPWPVDSAAKQIQGAMHPGRGVCRVTTCKSAHPDNGNQSTNCSRNLVWRWGWWVRGMWACGRGNAAHEQEGRWEEI